MPKTSYLCSTNRRATYPREEDPTFSLQTDLIANGARCVPLLWLAMFRSADIVRRTVVTRTEPTLFIELSTWQQKIREPQNIEIETEAPITSVGRAIEQIEAAIPYFNAMFQEEGRLDDYAELLIQALRFVTKKFVTIDLEEIAGLVGDECFWGSIRAALEHIGSPPTRAAKERLIDIAGFENLRRFPPANLALDDRRDAPFDDWGNHWRVLGQGVRESGFGRAVPWELEPRDGAWA